MSLAPDDHNRKGRSRSRSRDRRPREEYDTYEDVREPSFIYPEDDLDDRYKGHPEAQASGALPYPEEGGIYSMLPSDKTMYSYDSQDPTYKTASPTAESHYHNSHDNTMSAGGLLPGAFPDEDPRGRGKDEVPRTYRADLHNTYESRRDDNYEGRREDKHDLRREEEENKLKFLPQKYIRKFTSGGSSDPNKETEKEHRTGKDKYDDDLAYGKPAVPKRPPASHEELAYGKAAGIPATSSSQKMTSFGGTAAAAAATAAAAAATSTALARISGNHRKDERDEKHGESHQEEHDYKYDSKYYGKHDDRYDDRYDERADEKYRERYGGRSYEKRDEYRDDPRNYGREENHPSGKYIEDYHDPYLDERDEAEARRRPGKSSTRYDERYDDRYEERYDERYDERYYDERYERDRRGDERRSSRYVGDEGPDRRGDERRSSRYVSDEGPDRRGDERFSRYVSDEGLDRRSNAKEYDRYRYEKDDPRPLSPTAEATYAPNVLTVEPGSRNKEREKEKGKEKEKEKEKRDSSRRHHRERSSSDKLTVESGHKRDKSKSRDRSRARDKSPGPGLLTVESSSSHRKRSRSRGGGSSSLTVDTARVSGLSLASAPASPLLESYLGTYQESSPMPSPLLLPSQNSGEDLRALEPLSPLGSDFEDGKRRGRRARFHDSDDIPVQLAHALKGNKRPDTTPLIELLPGLTHDQVMELRVKYKAIVTTGPERKGVNIAKHIRARLKDEDPLLMKACYSVALGMWESEAYWANFWYQGDKTRRELLIESLMGRSNYEVRQIKEAFSDKKYDNSLVKCMKTELKEDKFKKAVLMVLDERRMEELDEYGRILALDYTLVDRDVSELRRAVRSEKGGETAMINIVVQRSDTHLREVLQEYERHHHSNFARDALKKSGNLVGELLAHILNGIINRPVRDALLLHHAISASRKDGLRRELLISRLVRYHWDQQHMRAVKQAYHERYGKSLSNAIRESTSGEWGQFCLELCITRTPDDVRRFDKVAVSSY